jgi:hypothetical protein
MLAQEALDHRPGDLMAYLEQLAPDLPVAPAGILTRQAHEQRDACGERRPAALRAVAEGPFPPDDLAVPAEQGRRGKDEADARAIGELGSHARQEHRLPARGLRLPRPALVELQLLAQEQQPVVVTLGDEVQEVEEARTDDVEDEEWHRQAPLVVRSIGRGRRSTVPAISVA